MDKDLLELCSNAKIMIRNRKLNTAENVIADNMHKFPHSPVPHNLMGIILECKNDRTEAMRHFRAAYALDPTYIPARYNLERYGQFNGNSKAAFSEDDCEELIRNDKYIGGFNL